MEKITQSSARSEVIPAQPSPPEIPQPISAETPKRKTLLIVGMSILLLLFLGIAGFLAYQNYQLRKQSSKPTTEKTPLTLSPTSAPRLASPTITPTIAVKKTIHPYPYPGFDLDTERSINKINIIALFFVPKDQAGKLKDSWLTNLEYALSEIKSFFEQQFDYQIVIDFTVKPQVIHGDLNTKEYRVRSIALEVKQKTKDLTKSDKYNVWMVYLVRDSADPIHMPQGKGAGFPDLQYALMYEFWLDDEAIKGGNPYGLVGSVHEFSHTLGIPHPWELPANKTNDPNFGNIPGDLMGYSNINLSLDKLYIRNDVKQAMGL